MFKNIFVLVGDAFKKRVLKKDSSSTKPNENKLQKWIKGHQSKHKPEKYS